jgi:phage gp36-like protein
VYCTKQDMLDRGWGDELLSIADPLGLGVIDDAILNKAIEDATGEIDGYLGARYGVPIVNPSENIVRYACDLARFFLYDKVILEAVQKRHDAIINYLKQAALGKIRMVVHAPTAGEVVGSSGFAVMTSGRTGVFG